MTEALLPLLAELGRKIDSLNESLSRSEAVLARLDVRLDGFEARIGEIEADLDGIKARLVVLENQI